MATLEGFLPFGLLSFLGDWSAVSRGTAKV